MVNICKYCKKDKTPLSPHRSYFRFPKDLNMREKWCTFFDLPADKIFPTTVVCSDHFKSKFMKNCGNRILLNPNAYPTIKTPNTKSLKLESASNIATDNVMPSIESDFSCDDITIKEEPLIEAVTSMDVDSLINTTLDSPLVSFKSALQTETVRHNYTRDDFATDSAYQDFIQYQQYKKQRFDSLRTKLYRREKQIERLKKTISEMKENSNNETTINFELLPKIVTHLIHRIKENKTTKPYSMELMNFSSSLHFQSPAAYNFVRQELLYCLPTVKTLQRCKIDNKLKSDICHKMTQTTAAVDQGENNIYTITFDEKDIKE